MESRYSAEQIHNLGILLLEDPNSVPIRHDGPQFSFNVHVERTPGCNFFNGDHQVGVESTHNIPALNIQVPRNTILPVMLNDENVHSSIYLQHVAQYQQFTFLDPRATGANMSFNETSNRDKMVQYMTRAISGMSASIQGRLISELRERAYFTPPIGLIVMLYYNIYFLRLQEYVDRPNLNIVFTLPRAPYNPVQLMNINRVGNVSFIRVEENVNSQNGILYFTGRKTSTQLLYVRCLELNDILNLVFLAMGGRRCRERPNEANDMLSGGAISFPACEIDVLYLEDSLPKDQNGLIDWPNLIRGGERMTVDVMITFAMKWSHQFPLQVCLPHFIPLLLYSMAEFQLDTQITVGRQDYNRLVSASGIGPIFPLFTGDKKPVMFCLS